MLIRDVVFLNPLPCRHGSHPILDSAPGHRVRLFAAKTSGNVSHVTQNLVFAPAHVIQVDLWMVPQAALIRPAAAVVLHAVGVEGLDLAAVARDDQLHQQLALWRQKQLLQLLRVLQLKQRLQQDSRML